MFVHYSLLTYSLWASHHLFPLLFPFIFSSFLVLCFPVLLILSELTSLMYSDDQVQGHGSVLER